jgi:hypothetical protein
LSVGAEQSASRLVVVERDPGYSGPDVTLRKSLPIVNP